MGAMRAVRKGQDESDEEGAEDDGDGEEERKDGDGLWLLPSLTDRCESTRRLFSDLPLLVSRPRPFSHA